MRVQYARFSILEAFPHPMTVTMVQLVMINCILWFNAWRQGARPRHLSRREWVRWILPLALMRVIANVSSQFSILNVPISYANTVKSLMPIFSVFLSKLMLGSVFTWSVYLSLVPIIGGVVLSSATELSFNMTGLLSSLLATFTFAIQNIYTKKVMHESGFKSMELLFQVCFLSLTMYFPFWYYYDGHDMIFGAALEEILPSQLSWLSLFLLGNSITNSTQSMSAFKFLALVTPVTYSIANVCKRIVVIAASMVVFRNPVTPANAGGMLLAIMGIAMYNRAKLKSADAEIHRSTLPIHSPHKPHDVKHL